MKFNQKNIHCAGFTLIELMIAMVIGLIATIVIMQTMTSFEGDKLATTGTSDAQTNANIGLFSISREVKQAGFALMSVGQNNIPDSALDCTGVEVNEADTGVTSIDSIVLTNGTSDTITIRYGSSDYGGAVSQLDESLNGKSVLGCSDGKLAIVIDSSDGSCDFTEVSNVSDAANTITFDQVLTPKSGDQFACIGDWNEVTYRVVDNNLVRDDNPQDDNAANDDTLGSPLVADIVNIQAQYGVSDSASSNTIVKWVDPINGDEDWSAPTLAQRKLIKAIRVAVVARNPYIEPETVTNACSSTSVASPTGLCAWEGVPKVEPITTASPAPAIDLSADADWRRYHYSVYESIMPLRNAIWAKGTL